MYRKAVVAWAHLGKPTRVLELVQSMADQGLIMGAQLHSQIIHGLAQAGKHEVSACSGCFPALMLCVLTNLLLLPSHQQGESVSGP